MGRKYEQEIEIAAPAERVWEAIASKEGIQSWFAPEARVTPGVGGEIWVSWGPGMEGGSKIDVWEPNEHQRFSSQRGDGREPNVVDFTIEAKSGDRTILRLVNSGFGDDTSFDAEVESTSRAWPLFMLLLKYSAEREHKECHNVTIFKMSKIPQAEAWSRITAPGIEGKELYRDSYGMGCWETPRRLTAVFCERCGGADAMLTLMCLVYDPAEGDVEKARAEGESLAARID